MNVPNFVDEALLSLDPFPLRKKIISRILANPQLLHTPYLLKDVWWLYKYYMERHVFDHILMNEYAKTMPDDEVDVDYKNIKITQLSKTIAQDTGKMRLELAAVAWLSIEDTNLLQELIPNISTDLHYKLVLDYPTPLIKACRYLIEPHNTRLDNVGLDDDAMLYIESQVIDIIYQNHFQNMTGHEVLKEINLHKLRGDLY